MEEFLFEKSRRFGVFIPRDEGSIRERYGDTRRCLPVFAMTLTGGSRLVKI
jgi:hypothetical protein